MGGWGGTWVFRLKGGGLVSGGRSPAEALFCTV